MKHKFTISLRTSYFYQERTKNEYQKAIQKTMDSPWNNHE